MPLGTTITGAAPVWVGDRLREKTHQGEVVHVGSDAIYFRSRDDVIGVVSRRATPIPCTISTILPTLDGQFSTSGNPQTGDIVTIGDGVAMISGTEVHVARLVDFQMPAIAPEHIQTMRTRLGEIAGESLQSAEIPAEVLEILRANPSEAVPLLLGRGSGLTPFGDDVVCGTLATLLTFDDPCAAPLRATALELAPDRTTSLSATLIRRAAEGDVLPVFANAVTALAYHPEKATENINRLLSIGHTSGAGMLLGFSVALDHITMRSCS